MTQRLAYFGGSFNPLHLGHLHVARAAAVEFDLASIHFLPAVVPPHKSPADLLPITDRLALLEAGLAEDPRFVIDRTEVEQGGTSYTFDTLSHLQQQLGPDALIHFLIGGDSLRDLPGWYRAEELARRFVLVTIPRDPALSPEQMMQPLADRFPPDLLERLARHVLPVAPLPISSTEVRRRIEAGQPIGDLVPAPVERLIRERGYYRS